MKVLCYLLLLLVYFVCCSVEAGPECFWCTFVESPSDCNRRMQCADDEVCYMHHYITDTGEEDFDLGCISHQSCGSQPGHIFGRQLYGGRHIKCALCCNERLCNDQLNCSTSYQPSTSKLARECSDLGITQDGVYTIYPSGQAQQPVRAYCIVDDSMHVWTVIQHRFDGSVNFYKNWQSYKAGFGQPDGEYWIGNDIIHELTEDSNHALMIKMTDFSNVTKFAEYLSFHVSSEANGYMLMVSKYDGNAGDSLSYHSGMKFSTFDKDQDTYGSNCAVAFKGAWWYGACHNSNLNGIYYQGHHNEYATGIDWSSWHGQYESLKSTIMMVRRY